MPYFNNLDQLNEYIRITVLEAMVAVNEEVKKILVEHIQQFYDEYEPKRYIRSYDLLRHSPIAVRPIIEGKNIVCEVYLEPSMLIQDGYHHRIDPKSIIEMASQGYHGTKKIKTNEKFIEFTVKQILQDKTHLRVLAERLRDKGFVISF